MTTTTRPAGRRLRAQIGRIPWFHIMPIRGVMTPGRLDVALHARTVGLPADLTGRRVIDVGANDGGVAFECERRGAAEVIALDHPTEWGRAGGGAHYRAGFDLAHKALGSSVRPVEADLESFDPASLGRFDLVLFLGVLYHLLAPVPVLRKVAALTAPGGRCLVETHVACLEVPYPALRFYEGAQLNADRTNWFGPNPAAVIAMLHAAGFRWAWQVGPLTGQAPGYRAVFHAAL